ncbi:Endothelin-converting enzyme 2 [Eufriesea mexicana]|nr:Endothelin-converting enzyme 2 [Eufriesea mexicana]
MTSQTWTQSGTLVGPIPILVQPVPDAKGMKYFPYLDEACIRERDGPEGVCDSKACEEASKRMVAFMKKGMDPCKDFYQFACGGIRDQQPYQPSSSFNMLQARVDDHLHKLLANRTGHMVGDFEKLGQFYNGCLGFKEKPVNFTPGKSEFPCFFVEKGDRQRVVDGNDAGRRCVDEANDAVSAHDASQPRKRNRSLRPPLRIEFGTEYEDHRASRTPATSGFRSPSSNASTRVR